ncbi:hypothetical protein J7T55_000691 [Diaporthe amygdali]|uniref:uncharacterized protein n=1 Tax=Phomopsis amygdali TaxID=1214568 RepID=UPI0022FE117C|nr:uncharacterized protein J7T55_000691 [Diaporthe amygdali]KAJ0110258.1 hypothetical protein J7T55_000691 [Diaporthe amygdali]
MNSPTDPSTPSTTPSPVTMANSNTQLSLSPPSTNARGAARRPPKLRSSCDACGAAKVRCDKTQPRCGRCAAGGITCVYGLSRKFGKAPRKKTSAETNAPGDASSKSLAQNAHQNGLSCFPDYRPLSGATTRGVKYEPRSAASPNFGLEDSLMAFTSHTNHDMFMPSPDSLENFNDTYSFADAPHSRNAILRPDPRHHGTVDPLDLTFSASDYSSFSEWIHPDDLLQTPDSQHTSEADSAQMPSHRLPTSFSSHESFPDTSLLQTDSHHCQKLAYATLDSLSLKQDSIARGEHLTQTMDKVLNRNKNAVDNMRQLLGCPCSKSPHLAMLYASITSKILMWYQLAAGCARPNTATTATWDSLPPLGSQTTPPLSASSSPSATCVSPASPVAAAAAAAQKGFVVTPMQFSAGAFSVDDEAAQEALRRQLLLSELKKAGNLIDLLCLQGRGETAAPGEVNDIYSALGTWLKCELNRTVGSLQS